MNLAKSSRVQQEGGSLFDAYQLCSDVYDEMFDARGELRQRVGAVC